MSRTRHSPNRRKSPPAGTERASGVSDVLAEEHDGRVPLHLHPNGLGDELGDGAGILDSAESMERKFANELGAQAATRRQGLLPSQPLHEAGEILRANFHSNGLAASL